MRNIAAINYDPATAATAATTALLAMTAIDTTNLRHSFTVPASGKVRVVIECTVHGGATGPAILLGVLQSTTVICRVPPRYNAYNLASTTLNRARAEFTITGLTPGDSLTWDAAYSVETLLASTAIKWGGPNNTTANDAFGAFTFEIWDADPFPANFPLTSIDSNGRVDVSKIAGQTASAAGAVTFPDAIASTTNITAGTITTATNLTNLPAMPTDWVSAAGVSAAAIAKFIAGGVASESTLTTIVGVLGDLNDTRIVFNSMVEADGMDFRFTTNALEQAPSGGGGGGTDWTADERTAIRSILGIPGSGTTPADPSAGILDTIRDAVGVVDGVVDSIASGVNVTHFGGTAGTFLAGVPSVNTVWWAGQTVFTSGDDDLPMVHAETNGGQFTAIPWNAAWDEEVQSEVADALAAYSASTLTAAQVDTQLSGTHGAGSWATATGFSTHSAADVWAVATRALTDKAGFTISGTLTTLDGFNTSLNSAHGAGSWATATGFAVPGSAMTLASGERDSIATALLDLSNGVETSVTVRGALRAIASAVAGVLSGAGGTGSATVTVRAVGHAGTTRLTVETDEDGNRTSVTLG